MKWLVIITNLFLVSYGLELTTKKGLISGTDEYSLNGRRYYAFRRIPYAQPPVGDLRFKNPQPHSGWSGTVNGDEDSPMCSQKYIFVPDVRHLTIGQEDCLYLNIYTPFVEIEKGLPVMIYIHGGSFICGMPGPREGAVFLMDKDVVLVTVAYRLGALGFLSTEDNVIPGNFGLKDQAMAVKWLSENIDDYGGDPDSMIVFGESSGGACAQYLITSPTTRHLLKGGISQSGVLDSIWGLSYPGQAKEVADKFIKDLGCDSYWNVERPLLECLQAADEENILQSQLKFVLSDFDPALIFIPVVEKENEGSFLTEDPRTIQTSLPWMTGYSKGEGGAELSFISNHELSLFHKFIKNIDKVLPILLAVKPGTPGLDKLISLVKKTFFFNLNDRDVLLEQVERFYYELYFVVPLAKSLKSYPGPKYAYFYTDSVDNSLADRYGPTNWISRYREGSPMYRYTHIDVPELIMKIWTNFAKSRNPTSEGVPFDWEQYSDDNYLHIYSTGAKMEKISLDNITEFWANAFSLVKPTTKGGEL